MPYVLYWGGCLAIFPGAQSWRGAYKLSSSSLFSRTRTSLSYVRGRPFILQGGVPDLHISIVISWSAGGSFVFVSRRVPPGRSGVERLESGWFSWAMGCQTVPSPVSRGGLATRSVARRSSPILSVRTRSSVRSAATRPSLRGFCLKDGTPVEGRRATVRR